MKEITKSTIEILNILPTKRCISPKQILKIMKKEEPQGMYCIINNIIIIVIIQIH